MLIYFRCSNISSTFSYHGLLCVLLHSGHRLNVSHSVECRNRPLLQKERLPIFNDPDVDDNCHGYVLIYATVVLVGR
jgi:hypothetical protein